MDNNKPEPTGESTHSGSRFKPALTDSGRFVCTDGHEHIIGKAYDERRGTGNGPQVCLGCKQTLVSLIAQHDKELLAAVRPAHAQSRDRLMQEGFNYCLAVFDANVKEYQQRKTDEQP